LDRARKILRLNPRFLIQKQLVITGVDYRRRSPIAMLGELASLVAEYTPMFLLH
jgi:hypothetical protein